MAIGFAERFKCGAKRSHQVLGGIVDERWCHQRASRPSEGTPKGGTQVFAVFATPGQLDCFAALVFQ